MKKTPVLLTIALLALVGSGCSTVETKPLSANAALNPKNAAVQYYMPKGVVTVSVIQTDAVAPSKTPTFRLSMSDVAYVPDTSQRLGLYYDRNILAEDIVTVGVSAKGLLTKVNVSSEDKTGAIAVKMAELAKEVSKFGILENKPGETTVFQQTIDPFDGAAVAAVNTAIAPQNLNLKIKTPAPVPSVIKADAIPGLAYRPLIPCEVVMTVNGAPLQSILYVPDPSVVNTFPINRHAFIKMVSNVTFDNGVLTEFTINKPSEALGVLTPAVDLAKMITSIPGELLTFKVTEVKDDTALLQALDALRQAQKKN